jgi:hypothetical protein
LVLLFDEVDYLRSAGLLEEFCTLMRAIDQDRASNRGTAQISLMFASVVNPIDFIKNPNVSPFTVGNLLRVSNFSLKETESLLLAVCGSEARDCAPDVYRLVGGQPFLTCCAADCLNRGIDAGGLDRIAADESGPFALHLDMLRASIIGASQGAQKALRAYIDRGIRPNIQRCHEFVDAGLMTLENGEVRFSCTLYEQFCREFWS